MQNTALYKIANILKRYAEDHEVIGEVADDIVGEFIEDEEVKTWFYNQAGIIRPEKVIN